MGAMVSGLQARNQINRNVEQVQQLNDDATLKFIQLMNDYTETVKQQTLYVPFVEPKRFIFILKYSLMIKAGILTNDGVSPDVLVKLNNSLDAFSLLALNDEWLPRQNPLSSEVLTWRSLFYKLDAQPTYMTVSNFENIWAQHRLTVPKQLRKRYVKSLKKVAKSWQD